MNPTRLKLLLPYILSITALGVFVFYLLNNLERYRELLTLSPGSLSALLGLAVFFVTLNGISNYLLYRGLGVPLVLNEAVGLAAINTLANQLPFAGGLIAKGVYLKQRYRLEYSRYLSATVALYVCYVSANGVVGVAVLGYWAFANRTTIPLLLVFGFAAMAASILLFFLPIRIDPASGTWKKYLTQLLGGWEVLSQNRTLTLKLVLLQIVMTVVFAARFWIAFHALSQPVSMPQCILFSAATILTRLVSIAPGGLGVREAIVAGVAAVLGFDPGVSVVAVAMDRAIATLIIIALGAAYTYILSRRLSDHPVEPEDSIPSADDHVQPTSTTQ